MTKHVMEVCVKGDQDRSTCTVQDMSESLPTLSSRTSQMGVEMMDDEGNDGWDNDEDWGSLDDTPASKVCKIFKGMRQAGRR